MIVIDLYDDRTDGLGNITLGLECEIKPRKAINGERQEAHWAVFYNHSGGLYPRALAAECPRRRWARSLHRE